MKTHSVIKAISYFFYDLRRLGYTPEGVDNFEVRSISVFVRMVNVGVLGLEEIFDVDGKIIIGVVHLRPLPGSPMWDGDIGGVIEDAVRDAVALEEGGVHGIIVENYGDRPYVIRVRRPETIAAFSLAVKEVVRSVSVPVGVNMLRNSAIEAAAIAYVCGARFLRVNAYVEAVVSDSGILQPVAGRLLRYIRELHADLGIFADVQIKHAAPLASRELRYIVMDAFERGKASCVILTGKRTGEPPSVDVLREASSVGLGPVLIGSGLRPENIGLLRYARGAIVGTYFRRGSKIGEPVEVDRVRRLMRLVAEIK